MNFLNSIRTTLFGTDEFVPRPNSPNNAPSSAVVPAPQLHRFSELPQDIQWIILSKNPELFDTLKFREVCKEWNDFLPGLVQNFALAILKEPARFDGGTLSNSQEYAKERGLKMREAIAIRSDDPMTLSEMHQNFLEGSCLNALHLSRKSDCQTIAFHQLVSLNNALYRQYEALGVGSLFRKTCLRTSFEAMEETRTMTHALCFAWQAGLQAAISAKNTSDNNPEYIKIPDEDASYSEILAFLETKEVEKLLGSVKRIEITGKELEFIPTQINLFTQLKHLNLSDNQIKGLPFLQLPCLKTLKLSGNQISELPQNIGNLPNLRKLCLDHNKFTEFPSRLPKSLEKLSLGGNPLSLENIAFSTDLRLPNLFILDLRNSPFPLTAFLLSTQTFFPENFPQLARIRIYNTGLSDDYIMTYNLALTNFGESMSSISWLEWLFGNAEDAEQT